MAYLPPMSRGDRRRAARAASRELSAKSWQVLTDNGWLYRYVWTGLGLAVLVAVPLLLLGGGAVALTGSGWAVVPFLALAAYGGTFMVVYRTGAMVAAIDAILHGQPATYADGLAAARRRRGPLAVWALIQTVVGWLLSALRGDASNDQLIVAVIRAIVAALVGAAWSLVTLFTVPLIMLADRGAGRAIRESVGIFRQRWGTQILGEVRIVARVFLRYVLPGLLLVVAGIAVIAWLQPSIGGGGVAVGAVLIAAGIGFFVVAGIVQSAVRSVFGVALFRYATEQQVLGPFRAQELDAAVLTR